MKVKNFENYNLLNVSFVCRMIANNQVFLSFCKNNCGFCLQINIKVVPLQPQIVNCEIVNRQIVNYKDESTD